MQTHTLLALSNPVEGREAEFNQWFDTVHIPEVLRVPGFASVQRFEAAAQDFLARARRFDREIARSQAHSWARVESDDAASRDELVGAARELGAFAACGVMFRRMIVLVASIQPALLRPLGAPLAASGVVPLLLAVGDGVEGALRRRQVGSICRQPGAGGGEAGDALVEVRIRDRKSVV